MKIFSLSIGLILGAVVLSGCQKAQEVVPPMSDLQTSLQTTPMPTVSGGGPTLTPQPWPTTAVTFVITPGSVTPTVWPTPATNSGTMTTQPQTGPGVIWWAAIILGLGAGLGLVAWEWRGQRR